MFEWAPLLQAELMSVSVASPQAELVLLPVLVERLLPVLVERLLPVLAVGQMLVPHLSPEVMKALKLIAAVRQLVAPADM